MKKLSLIEYLKSPCSTASIPYWKQKELHIPKNIKIVHDKYYVASDFADYTDEIYFRLYHDLNAINKTKNDNIELIAATSNMVEVFVDIINGSYNDITVTKKQMESYFKSPVYNSELWVLLKDKTTENYIGSGIADYDKEIGEVILEWIQVIPSYRGRGYGQVIVNHLLSKMQGKAKFATVSCKVNNPTNPESLYRKCGFIGNDIWHILSKK